MASFGATTVGCLAAAGAAGSATTAAISNPPTSWANAAHILEESVIGAGIAVATLGAGKILGPIASRAAAPALTRLGITPATQTARAITNSVVPRAATNADDAARATAGRTTQRPVPAGCNSFIPATPVLMADGTTKAIEDINTGDLVLAADPADPDYDQPATQRVVATILGDGLKDLVDITIDSQTITATAGHPFWVAEDGQSLFDRHGGEWVDAGDLQPGDRLLEPDGDTLTIDHVRTRTALTKVHNLTISGVHTYYVTPTALDGATTGLAVLVHNTSCPIGSPRSYDIADKVAEKHGFMGFNSADDLARHIDEIVERQPGVLRDDGALLYRDGDNILIVPGNARDPGTYFRPDNPDRYWKREMKRSVYSGGG